MSDPRPRRILVQLDPDKHASLFDAVVAIDADVDVLLQYDRVEPVDVRDLVYGALFTRGTDELQNTALFIGGTDVEAGEQILAAVEKTFFGPMRVSVMLDANGANTTASAAVIAAGRHLELGQTRALVLGGTGPVGRRVALLLAREGAHVRLASRSLERAQAVCEEIGRRDLPGALEPVQAATDAEVARALSDIQLTVACGAAGVRLASTDVWASAPQLQVAIDLNAVPPSGLEGIEPTAKADRVHGRIVYGAIGVGGTKMKIHRAAIRSLFQTNKARLDAEEIYEMAKVHLKS